MFIYDALLFATGRFLLERVKNDGGRKNDG